jgi:hypothetical protein
MRGTYTEGFSKVEAGEGSEFHTGFLGRLCGSPFLRNRRRQGSLGVVGDVGTVPLVRRKGDHQLDVVVLDETWKGIKQERREKVEFHLRNSVFFFSSNISNNASWTWGMRAATFLWEAA